MFCIVEILANTPIIDGSEHMVKLLRRGDLKVLNIYP